MSIVVAGSLPAKDVTYTANTDDPALAVKRFLDKYPSGRVEAVNGNLVRGICHVCYVPIMRKIEGPKTFTHDGNCYTCRKCGEESPKHESHHKPRSERRHH